MKLQDLFESPQLCSECGGVSFSDLILAEKKDACYYKVKASAKVWPSAYASGRLVQCRKKGAANYGKSKNEGLAEGSQQKTFKVVYYSLNKDRNITTTIKANNESDVWDQLKAKGIDVVSVKEQGVAEATGDAKFDAMMANIAQGVTARKNVDTVKATPSQANPEAMLAKFGMELIAQLEKLCRARCGSNREMQDKPDIEPKLSRLANNDDGGEKVANILIDLYKISPNDLKEFAREFNQQGDWSWQNFATAWTQGEWNDYRRQWIDYVGSLGKGVTEGSLSEFAPSGGEGNGPMDYGRAIIEIGEEFIDYYTDEGSGSDAAKIIKVGNTFIAKGMAAGINAFYTMLDTQVRDHVAEQLMDQGFNVRQDIYAKGSMAPNGQTNTVEQDKKTILMLLQQFVKTRTEPEDRQTVAAIYKYFQQDLARGFAALYDAYEFDIDSDFTDFASEQGIDLNALADKYQQDVAEDAALAEEFDLIESTVERLAKHNDVDAETIWEDLESLSNDELYVFAVTMPLTEDWQKANKKDRTDGMSRKAVKAYRREHPGSKLKTAVTTKPSKLKRGSKASKRRKSYCSRSRGQMKMHSISCAKTPDKAICKARRRWNCE